MSASVKIPVSMTVEEFLSWDPGDGQSWQLVDGEPQAMAPANRTHNSIQSEVVRVIGNHLIDAGSACSVLTTPGVVPEVLASHNFRIPDVGVTCTDYTVEEVMVQGMVLAVEILSVNNKAETWSNVWTYTSIPTMQEILVLHAATIRAEVLRRGSGGNWPSKPEQIATGDVVLDSIGLRVPLASLYRTTRLRRSA